MSAPTAVGIPVEGLRIERHESVLRFELDRPNSTLSKAMVAAMVAELDRANQDDETRVVVLTATGRNFCTGMDLAESNKARERKPRVGNHQRRIAADAHRLVRAFTDVQLPVVAGVRGWAAGVGLALALSADHVVADTTAKFWAPYVGRGFTPDCGTTYLLPRAVGVLRAKHMLMRGKPVDAATALAWGLVSEVAEPDEFDVALTAITDEFGSAATVSVGLTRDLIARAGGGDLAEALRNEEFAEEVSLRSTDFREGIAALRERRAPVFGGQ
jgi:2-(1,2-epoxy-1,2-dihydrophenyl)acetyl-CoA isomerase